MHQTFIENIGVSGFAGVYWSSLQEIHYGQAFGGRTTRVKVFVEDSSYRLTITIL